MQINNRFYRGYEGEPEVQFIAKNAEHKVGIGIWDGYFDDIMRQFTPGKDGWTGVAKVYHTDERWEDGIPCKITDLNDTLKEFSEIDLQLLEFDDSAMALSAICVLLNDAIQKKMEVWIIKD